MNIDRNHYQQRNSQLLQDQERQSRMTQTGQQQSRMTETGPRQLRNEYSLSQHKEAQQPWFGHSIENESNNQAKDRNLLLLNNNAPKSSIKFRRSRWKDIMLPITFEKMCFEIKANKECVFNIFYII